MSRFKLKAQVKKWLAGFKSKMPSKAYLKSHPRLKWISDHLDHAQLWHFTKDSVPKATFIGLFVGCMPIPFQMLIAIFIGVFARANIIICVVGCWISNPFTIPPMLFAAYKVGKWILNAPSHPLPAKITFSSIMAQLPFLWQPLLVGCLAIALVLASIGYLIARLSWRAYHQMHHD